VASNRNTNFQIVEHLDVLDKKKQKKKSRKTAKGRANRVERQTHESKLAESKATLEWLKSLYQEGEERRRFY